MEPANSAVVVAKPDWVMSRADGQRWMAMHGSHRMAWLNLHPEVRERFIGLVIETLKRCPMQGLQLDDHFAWPVEFGYDPFTESCTGTRRVWRCQWIAPNRHWMTWRRKNSHCCANCEHA